MAIALKPQQLTPADELRQLLTRCEDRLINLAGPSSVAELFAWLDQIADLLPTVQATGVDLRAEEARWESLLQRLQARASKVMRAWQGSAQLALARQAAAPAQDRWWWWIDEWIAQQRRRKVRRALVTALAVLAGLAAIILLFQRLFPVDPQQRAAYRWQLQAETELAAGNLAAGSEALERALEIDSQDYRLWILHGAIADVQGNSAAAESSWQQARDLLSGAETEFLIERGLSYVRLQHPDKAIADLEAAIALDPASARAHLVLGSALDSAGRLRESLAAYEQAAALAEAANNPELVVLARIQISSLLQRLSAETMPTQGP